MNGNRTTPTTEAALVADQVLAIIVVRVALAAYSRPLPPFPSGFRYMLLHLVPQLGWRPTGASGLSRIYDVSQRRTLPVRDPRRSNSP